MTDYVLHYTLAPRLAEAVEAILPGRAVTYTEPDADELVTMTFTPGFAGENLITVDRMHRLLRFNEPIDPARWRAITDEVQLLRDYHALASPTNVQSVAAIKAIIRVLRALIAD